MKRIAVIDVTDLYHPHQDCGDNVDLLSAFGLPEIDLRAIILDCTERFRQAVADHPNPDYRDPTGPRDPGFIPVLQLNYLFGRDVPAEAGPFSPMKSPHDTMNDVPRFQQNGVNLILKVLRESDQPVHILSFGSGRTIAAAFNREPQLMHEKVARVHLSAGGYPYGYLEWNVMLDPHAIVCLLSSGLPIAIYPCATHRGPFDYGRHNTFWKLTNLEFIRHMNPGLRRYLCFAFGRTIRMDFLRAMDEDEPAELLQRVCAMEHKVWETAVWAQVANRRIVGRADGSCSIVPAHEVLPTDRILPNDLKPCHVNVDVSGQYHVEFTDLPSNFWLYDRNDPGENERALREAVPRLYTSFRCPPSHQV
jgi:pyrimidine-specific ribonucleoside hydrolase